LNSSFELKDEEGFDKHIKEREECVGEKHFLAGGSSSLKL
jgi:hypothetical protein